MERAGCIETALVSPQAWGVLSLCQARSYTGFSMSYLRSRTYNCVRERPRRRAAFDLFVLKDISADDLVSCIRNVLAGKTYLAPAAAAKLAEGVTRVQLTPREMATLGLLADGKANKEIASALDISERTVKTHLGHLLEKLGVTSRTEAVKVANRRGLVRLD